jgi:glycogen synthase
MKILYAFSDKAPSGVQPFEPLIKAIKKMGHDVRTHDSVIELNDLLLFLKQDKWRPDVIHFVGDYPASFSTDFRELKKNDSYFVRTAPIFDPIKETCGLEGVDYEKWNPVLNQKLARRYSRGTLSLKIKNKAPLQMELGLPEIDAVPLIAILADSEGQNELVQGISEVLKYECQIVCFGILEQALIDMKGKFPEKLGIKAGFDIETAQKIFAASDLVFLPFHSRLCEPIHLIGFKYGALPIIARRLSHTVTDFDLSTGKGDGFVYYKNTSGSLLSAVRRAIEIYKNKYVWRKIQERVMQYDFSWSVSAKKHLALYVKALDKVIK